MIQLLTSAGFSLKKWLFGKRLLMRRSYIVKKGNQGADSTWAPFEETTKGPSPPHAPSHEVRVTIVNESADHPHAGR